MIEWIRNWVQGIIFAVIVSAIIEMIIPEGKSKKYIKTIIGVYIVYVIIGPVISQFTGKELKIDMNQYLEQESQMTYSAINIDNTIKENYIQNLKNDIKNKLSEKGYVAETIDVSINEVNENYGEILEIKLKLKDKRVNNIKIEEVEISKKSEDKTENKEYEDIKKYLSNEYGTENIIIDL